MGLRRRAEVELLILGLWLVAVSVSVDYAYSLSMSAQVGDAVQIASYLVSIAPIMAWSPGTVRTLRAPRAQLGVGVGLVIAALLYAAYEHLYPGDLVGRAVALWVTGLAEELLFRGFIWERLRTQQVRGPGLVVLSDIAFTAWHVIPMLSGLRGASSLISVASYGLLFSVTRLWSGNTGLPALMHVAIDIAGK